ncbi:chaperonin 10-like protein [Phycomyces blakesleeanus]
MGYTIKAIASTENPEEYVETTYEAPSLGEADVYIKMKACGVCHTDYIFQSMVPPGTVLGHEPIGVIEELGSKVTKFEKGDLVGFSFLKNCCLDCPECNSGDDYLCRKRVMFPEGGNNGFAEAAVVNSRFVYKIPKGLEAKDAAPLMCAGVTVFSALIQSGVTPTGRIGVVGIGGLGHLALQFSRAWGCHVTAISTSPSKKEEALGFGAHDYISSRDFGEDFVIADEDKYDVILNTVSAKLNWDEYLNLLKPAGKFMMIGIPDGSIEVKDVVGMIMDRRAVVGTILGGRSMVTSMLEFATRHNIKPAVEEYPFTATGLADAIISCHTNKARYRGVLVAEDQ